MTTRNMDSSSLAFDCLRQAVQELGLTGRPLCVHASIRSFGTGDVRPSALADALLAEHCTILVPTFSYTFGVPPPTNMRPARNGWDYASFADPTEDESRTYTPETNELDRDMGALAAEILKRPDRKRGNHPLNSFTALGPLASNLVREQTPSDVYAPLKALAEMNGFVVLMGVGLDKLTLIHLAEQLAGRTLFRRWANGSIGQPIMVAVGGCANGFGHFESALAPKTRTKRVVRSFWRVLPAQAVLDATIPRIRDEPTLTHCGEIRCERCNDAVAGGPIITIRP